MDNEKKNINNEINDGKNDVNTSNFTNQVNEKLADKSKQTEDKKNLIKNDEKLSNKSDKESEFED